MALWWACQDLNLGPHPYQAHSRDALKQQEGETPAQRRGGSDRGCPLGTVVDRPMWHASGTAGENEVGSASPRRAQLGQWARPVLGDASLVGKGRRPAAGVGGI